ncbi:MAG: riboflavin kinase / adenylyltransferase [Variibacter sp.]|nr:riboflavin kinase / adenylyltransferase [Variibacter sp.]
MHSPPLPQHPFEIIRDDAALPPQLAQPVIAIGNFDGVHRGHQAVIMAAVSRARTLGRPALALTFEPHPRRFFRPDMPMFRLSDPAMKLRLLSSMGLDGAIVRTFDAGFAAVPAGKFVEQAMVGKYDVSGLSVGFDFHFGKGREGSPQFLLGEGQRRGFPVEIVPQLEVEGRPVSSSVIRTALEQGQVVEAAALLGRLWSVSGDVLHGEKRGRDLGFPTANMRLDPDCGLKQGIYAVRAAVDGRPFEGVASFGRRPTFDNGAPLLETYLFDFAGDLYGRTLDVAFAGWIRPELKFDSAEALVARMHEDARLARQALARAEAFVPPPLLS